VAELALDLGDAAPGRVSSLGVFAEASFKLLSVLPSLLFTSSIVITSPGARSAGSSIWAKGS